MRARAVPGRRAPGLFGTASATSTYSRQVYEIIRSARPEEGGLPFGKIWPQLKSDRTHKSATAEGTWRKVTTQRCLALLVGEGWVERSPTGYSIRTDLAFSTYNLVESVRLWAEAARGLLRSADLKSKVARDTYLMLSLEWVVEASADIGLRVRAVFEAMADHGEDLGIDRSLWQRGGGTMSVRARREFALGLMWPETQDITSEKQERDLSDPWEFFSGGFVHPSPQLQAARKKIRENPAGFARLYVSETKQAVPPKDFEQWKQVTLLHLRAGFPIGISESPNLREALIRALTVG